MTEWTGAAEQIQGVRERGAKQAPRYLARGSHPDLPTAELEHHRRARLEFFRLYTSGFCFWTRLEV